MSLSLPLKSLFVGSFLFSGVAVAAAPWRVVSPDGTLGIEVRSDESRQDLAYRVTLEDQTIVDWSQLGLVRSGWIRETGGAQLTTHFDRGLVFQSAERQDIHDTYTMVTGKRLTNEVHGRELALNFTNADGHPMRLELRAFNRGVAFRYMFPDEDMTYQTIEAEKTAFNLGTDGKIWAQKYQTPTFWTPAYENFFLDGVPLGSSVAEPDGIGWALPLLAQTPDAWILIHEANLDGSYHGVHLHPEPQDGIYVTVPPDQRDGIGVGSHQARSPLPWTLPWRLLIVSPDLGDIVESNLVFDLAAPSRIKDPSWIKPGVSSWSWWSDHDSSQNMAALESFIDLAADMDWAYSLVDANWNLISDTAREEMADYAAERGVDLLFWYNSGGAHNAVTEQPRNILSDTDRRRAEFAKLQRLGIKGVKIDFFQSDKQFVIDYYLDILADAAAHELVVNFHGCTIPRGWERTWPNLVTSEAVLGAEAYSFNAGYAAYAPVHNTILPFTRNVIGPMDYTPVTWTEWDGRTRLTSPVHEVALAVVFESGIQHLADAVGPFRALPTAYQTFFANLPTVWDETRYLAGFPGQDVVLARRHGDAWFVAGINGEGSAKPITLDLSPLALSAQPSVLLHDGADKDFASRELTLAPTELMVELPPYGGFVIAPR